MATTRGQLALTMACIFACNYCVCRDVGCPQQIGAGSYDVSCPYDDVLDTHDDDGSVSLLQGHTHMLKEEWPCVPNFWANTGKAYNDKQQLSPDSAFNAYQSLHVIDVIFKQQNITYWAADGTLLGALRNKGIIPHDDDIDLHMLLEDLHKLASANVKKLFAQNDLMFWLYSPEESVQDVGVNTVHSQMSKKTQWWGQIFSIRTCAHIGGIFPMERGHGNELRGALPEQPPYPLDVAEHLEASPFGSSTVPTPGRGMAEAYLAAMYGKDWNTTVNCNGVAHGCTLLDNESWDLVGMATPCSPLQDPLL